MTPLTLVLYLLAVTRLTHLLVVDSILDGPRDWWESQPGAVWRTFSSAASCPWCSSFWVALLLAGAIALGLPDWALAIPAASYVTGWLETSVDAMDGPDEDEVDPADHFPTITVGRNGVVISGPIAQPVLLVPDVGKES